MQLNMSSEIKLNVQWNMGKIIKCVQLNLKVGMKCSMKYECENEMFNEIWELELNVQWNM